MARAWQEHGKHMAGAWQEHGTRMPGAWQEHGRRMAGAWQNDRIYKTVDDLGGAGLVGDSAHVRI